MRFTFCTYCTTCKCARDQLVKMLISLKRHRSKYILIKFCICMMYAGQHCLTTGMHNSFFWWKRPCRGIRLASYGQLVEMLILLEPDGIFRSHFAYVDLFLHFLDTCMQNDDEALPSIILAGRGLLVKMLLNLEPHGIFGSILHTYTFNIV